MAVIRHDNYYHDQSHLTLEERKKINYDHPDSLDNEMLIRHLEILKAQRLIEMPTYDFSTSNRKKETIAIQPSRAIILEGILIFCDKRLRDLMDIKIFIDTDDDLRIIRRIDRDIKERGRTLDSVVSQYLTSVKPMHFEFVEPSKRWADIIIPNGVENNVGLNIVVNKILNIFEKRDV